MSTITKEWLLKTIAELEEERDATPGTVNEDAAMALEAMKIALASLEAEPVAYVFKHPAGRLFWALTDESNKGQSDVMPVYSASVPAFVPPVIEPDYEVIKGILPTANPDEYACCIAADMWNACRAAMLQGADGNSPVIPDGWVMLPAEPTQAMMNAWLSEVASWRGHAAGYRAMIASAPKQEVKNV
ncbi:hypothetical protein [Enterobacter cloacae complex sp. IR5457]|uniref:hypothetical protein n=1 Tax=Enterobacter cloacae complex sp. IR5457 TaxID=3412374 RepID=UPI003B9EAD61